MKDLTQDVKTRLTRTAFNVPPHLIGRSLATPKRRLAALLVDLIIASSLANLMGLSILPVIGVIFILPTFIKGLKLKISKRSRILLLVLGILLIFTTIGIKSGEYIFNRFIEPLNTGKFESKADSLLVENMVNKIETAAEKDTTGEAIAAIEELKQSGVLGKSHGQPMEVDSMELVKNFYLAYQSKDSAKIALYRQPMQNLIAGELIARQDKQIEELTEEVDQLDDELDEARDKLENPSFIRTARAFVNDIGLSAGWVAFYFVFCWFLFDGKSPGKKLFHIQIIRMNGHSLKLWYCFERFSGFAAGLATGLLGFLQIYWDDNRQCIHDKIASTVVIDLKPRKRRK